MTALVLVPTFGVLIVGGVRAVARGGVATATGFWFTLGVSCVIGVLSVMMAWFPARVMNQRCLLGGLVLVPVLLPPYLIFAGYGMLRDPSWWLGAWLESLAAAGHPWATRWTGFGFAVVGLAAWAFPLAAMVLATGFGRHGREVDDALRLEAGGMRRSLTRVHMNAGSIMAAVMLVGLVMIGSAVPLHLAQIPTMAIEVWRIMSESPSSEWDGVWAASWPLVLVALAGAIWLAWWIQRSVSMYDQGEVRLSHALVRARIAAWMVWSVAAIGPLLMFAFSLRSVGSLAEFWKLSGPGVGAAFGYGAADAAVSLVLASSAALVAGQQTRMSVVLARVVLVLWVVSATIPGVFIGGVLARFGVTASVFVSGDGLVVLAHVARFGAIPVIVGLVVGWSEPRSRRELRVIDDGEGLVGWFCACWPWQWPMLVGSAVAVGLLGIHEIEATTLLLPPGRANLAGQILGYLHFSRTEELSAASMFLIGGGLVIAGVVSLLMNRRNHAS